jgi:hypothetical protein
MIGGIFLRKSTVMQKFFFQPILSVTILAVILVSCQKEIDKNPVLREEQVTAPANQSHGHLQQTKTFSSEVVQKWLDMKVRILRQAQEQNTPSGFHVTGFYSALGLSLYESVVPGMPAYQSLSDQLNDMPAMPSTIPGMAYHWAACANAALAQIFRSFLPNTSAANKVAIDSLENALNIFYLSEVNAPTFERSKEFGKAVAQAVFSWTQTDGFFAINPPYVTPVGPGLWQPTPPGFAAPLTPYFGNTRTLMPEVLNENYPPPPLSYSTTPGSGFYNSMVEIYNTTSMLLNPVLKAQANYWRGTAGGSGFITWYAILRRVLAEQGNEAMLDKAAITYCKMGIVIKDAAIATYKAKYYYNELAPITYIRNVLGFNTWNSDFPTTPLPCYPELHSMQNSACAAVLTQEFGDNYQVNTNGVHPNGLPGYIFNSFADAAIHGNQSRLLAGVGTQHAVIGGAEIGSKTAEYLNKEINFLKEY